MKLFESDDVEKERLTKEADIVLADELVGEGADGGASASPMYKPNVTINADTLIIADGSSDLIEAFNKRNENQKD